MRSVVAVAAGRAPPDGADATPAASTRANKTIKRRRRCKPLLGQRFADSVGDRLHLELGACDLGEELLGRHPLPLRPELTQERAGFALREPGGSDALPEVVAELRLERPRAQVAGGVEAGIEVGEVVRGAGLD